MINQAKTALILVDLQNDFCHNGSLAVPDGDAVIPLANQLQAQFDQVVATQDWHPQDHVSFASNHPGKKVFDLIEVNKLQQVLWPDHCVQNSSGAAFHPQLHTGKIQKIIHKGTDKTIDSYSAFFDNAHLRSTGLAEYLRERGIDTVYIMGLATDYCVKYSCLDAVFCGFQVCLIEDACRGVGLKTQDIADSIDEMRKSGVKIMKITDITSKK